MASKVESLKQEISSLEQQNKTLASSQFESKCITGPTTDPKKCLKEIASRKYNQNVEPRVYFTSVFNSMNAAYKFQQEIKAPVAGLLFKKKENELILDSLIIIKKNQLTRREYSSSLNDFTIKVNNSDSFEGSTQRHDSCSILLQYHTSSTEYTKRRGGSEVLVICS